jgi:hypothetical protein
MSDYRILIVAALAPVLVLLGLLSYAEGFPKARPGIPVTALAIELRSD